MKGIAKNTKKPKLRLKGKKKASGEPPTEQQDGSSDVSLETKFLLILRGRLFIQTNDQKEALSPFFGRWWKPITHESKSIANLCGIVKPTDGLYKIEGKKITKLLSAQG